MNTEITHLNIDGVRFSNVQNWGGFDYSLSHVKLGRFKNYSLFYVMYNDYVSYWRHRIEVITDDLQCYRIPVNYSPDFKLVNECPYVQACFRCCALGLKVGYT